jgi:endoglucanase
MRIRHSLIKLATFFLCAVSAALATPSVAATCDHNAVLKGVNIAGAEFNAEQLPGILFKNYIYPNNVELDYFHSIGATVIRLPFLWERIQPTLFGELAPTELQNIATVVALAKSNGMCVILDVHNYGSYRGKAIGSTQVPAKAFIDLWSRLAEQFGDASSTAFDLMNEPFNLPVDQWASIAQETVNAIRKQGAKNVILVAGGRWSGVHDWFADAGGVSNARAFAAFRDAEHRTWIEVHQYADANYSGTGQQCVAAGNFHGMFDKITSWARSNGQRLFLGEFGVPSNRQCLEALDVMLSHTQDSTVWRGWTYWAAGQWWGKYPLSIEPQNGRDAPQTAIIKKYLGKAR